MATINQSTAASRPPDDTPLTDKDLQLLAWAVGNCHTLARRRIRAGSVEAEQWGHIMRICEKAGIWSRGVLRQAITNGPPVAPDDTPTSGLDRRQFLAILGGTAVWAAMAPLIDVERLLWTTDEAVLRSCGSSWATTRLLTFTEWRECDRWSLLADAGQ